VKGQTTENQDVGLSRQVSSKPLDRHRPPRSFSTQSLCAQSGHRQVNTGCARHWFHCKTRVIMVYYPFNMVFVNARMKTLTHRVLCLSSIAAALVIAKYVIFFLSERNVLEEFHESQYAQEDKAVVSILENLVHGFNISFMF